MEHICAIDIGSSLFRVLVGRQPSIQENSIEILGLGSVPSAGVKTGSIINIEDASQAISEAIHEAEMMSGVTIESATVNVSGRHLQSENSRGVVAISSQDRTVSSEDVLRVIEGAQNIKIPSEQEVLHVLSKEFNIDEQDGIRDPIGMKGTRLEAEVHIVTAGITSLSNLNKAVSSCEIQLDGGVMSSLASAESFLSRQDKELGVLVIDIGGGVTDLILYSEGGALFSAVLPIGGIHITQDLSIGLKIPMEAAEFVKKNYGSSYAANVDPTEKIELPGVSGRPSRHVLRQKAVEIIEARLREIFEMTVRLFAQSEYNKSLSAGIMLCGGCALLEDIEDLAEEVIGFCSTVQYPRNIKGFSDQVSLPEFTTSVGILQYNQRMNALSNRQKYISVPSIFQLLKTWFVENL